ncbi:MAG: hypothetical protein HY766_15835, partial [candidate division NC10 bacterium]|nr:hypothetical protein [candidate division NC10 bacterium]
MLQTPHHHRADGSRGIEARLARHGISRRAQRDERGNDYDLTGTYDWAFISAGILGVLAAGMVLAIRERPVR